MRDNKGKFSKNHVPWNKDLKGIRLSPGTEFKKGQFIGDNHPSWKGGVQKVINDCTHLYVGANKRVRRPRQVYIDHYGEIPKGYVIVHLDGDRNNDSIFNLEAISRAENLRRNNLKKNL